LSRGGGEYVGNHKEKKTMAMALVALETKTTMMASSRLSLLLFCKHAR
jgi:hypothetical protein